MKVSVYRAGRTICSFLPLLLVLSPVIQIRSFAQEPVGRDPDRIANGTTATSPDAQLFRLETVPVKGGAELITIWTRLDGLKDDPTPGAPRSDEWVPMVSVLRDTLGDDKPENDRLTYLWALTYTRPTMRQRVLSAVPFFYFHAGNRGQCSGGPPPPLANLSAADREVWNRIFWTALQNILLDPYGIPLRASTRSYQRNISDYRRTHIIQALSVLALYQKLEHQGVFSLSELTEIQSRLLLTEKMFGGIVDDAAQRRYYEKATASLNDDRGHNWELLRQQAELNGLYFQPLEMPDRSATHAIVWVALDDLKDNEARRYNARFLNFANPWTDNRLRNWNGYVETRYFDRENRPVDADTPGARAVSMIPLALYGLDHPKIPVVLVDFRDSLNPKRREMSRRALQDVTKNVLAVSRFGNLPYFLGRAVFDFTTGRRGMDINQPARLQAYSQLKLLMALNESLQPGLRETINQSLEKVSLNPVENDLATETRLARQQYQVLLAYANRDDGLPARIERDRRAEMTALAHQPKTQIFFKVANIMSLGQYVHREPVDGEMNERLDVSRSLAWHTRFLRQVARSSPRIEVVWDLNEVQRSLLYLAQHGNRADSGAAQAAADIFNRTQDESTRRLCLESLARITDQRSRRELERISENMSLDQAWRELSAQYLVRIPRDQISDSSSRVGEKKVQQ